MVGGGRRFGGRVGGGGRAEIALATSVDAILLDAGGKILFRKPMHHTQHAVIGRFRPDPPGKQAFYVSREDAAGPGSRPTALEAIYTKSGELLWDNTRQKDADKDGWGFREKAEWYNDTIYNGRK